MSSSILKGDQDLSAYRLLKTSESYKEKESNYTSVRNKKNLN